MAESPVGDEARAPVPGWERYGRAVLHSMAEVLDEVPESDRHLLLETADYWLSVGLAIGTGHPEAASRLLELIESEEFDRAELAADAESFLAEALG